ncbi:unnamed protein product [Brachionus calyciflorus]|uniref:Selenocysteine lyase n=1 Tax=Brachionus calyciflorus TaxID=104777 RepID=A0A813XIS8_9BILA|nr:unnamed protein product [Brachionus calyciflorus]
MDLENNDLNQKIYLDFNATTPLDKQVIDSITKAFSENWSNPSSQYVAGKQAKSEINKSRQLIAEMINANSPRDILFVSGGTEANNLVFYSVFKHYKNLVKENNELKVKPHFIISNVEHDSVKLVAENYEKDNLAEISYANVNSHGTVEVNDIIGLIRPNTILISIMLANNETGVIQPLKELTLELKKLGIQSSNSTRAVPLYVHTDAAQAIGKIKVDVEDLQVDYLTIVGHKFYGPKIGALYARNFLAQNIDNLKKAPICNLFYGAGQENGLRPGTENTPMIVGLGKAAELVTKNLEQYSSHMKEIRDYLEEKLIENFGAENLSFNGKSNKSTRLPNTCNVSFIQSQEFKGYVVLGRCKYLEASTGSCCHSGEFKASKILLAMNIDKSIASNALRLSIGRETSKNDIDLVIQDLKDTLNLI